MFLEEEPKLLPTNSEKEAILAQFETYDLNESEVRLITSLPEAVSKATLEELKRSEQDPGEDVNEQEDHQQVIDQDVLESVQDSPLGDEAFHVESREFTIPEANRVQDHQERMQDDKFDVVPTPTAPASPQKEELRQKLAQIRQEKDVLKDTIYRLEKDLGEELERVSREKGVLKNAVFNLEEKLKVQEREAEYNMANMKDIIGQGVDAVRSLTGEKEVLADQIRILCTEREDYKQLDDQIEDIRLERHELQQRLADEQTKNQRLIIDLREYVKLQNEKNALCAELESKNQKAESDIDSLKQYITERNSLHYEKSMVLEEMAKDNKSLQSEIVHLKHEMNQKDCIIKGLNADISALERRLAVNFDPVVLMNHHGSPIRISPPKSRINSTQNSHSKGRQTKYHEGYMEYAHPSSTQSHQSRQSNLPPAVAAVEGDNLWRSNHPNTLEQRVQENTKSDSFSFCAPRANTSVSVGKENLKKAVEKVENGNGSAEYRFNTEMDKKASSCPYATDDNVSYSAEEKEKILLKLNVEKQHLESRYAKLPASSGRTLRERKEKKYIEDRLDSLQKEISAYRLSLRKGKSEIQ